VPPCLERRDEAVVDRGADQRAAELRLEPLGRTRDPIAREISKDQPLEQKARDVADLRRQAVGHYRARLQRHPEPFAGEDVGRGAHRDSHLRACRDKVARDVDARVAGADDQHLPATVRLGAAEVRGVDELAGVPVATGPVGELRNGVVAGRDHGVAREQRARGGLEPPHIVAAAIYSLERGAEAHRQPMVLGIALQVRDEVLAARIAAVAPRDPVAGQGREHARRVEPERLISRPPARAHPVRTLEHQYLESALAQQRGRCEPAGPAPATIASWRSGVWTSSDLNRDIIAANYPSGSRTSKAGMKEPCEWP